MEGVTNNLTSNGPAATSFVDQKVNKDQFLTLLLSLIHI